MATLGLIPGYQEMFKAAFPDSGITYDNMATAIGAFERRLVTPSAFDKFLAGDDKASMTRPCAVPGLPRHRMYPVSHRLRPRRHHVSKARR